MAHADPLPSAVGGPSTVTNAADRPLSTRLTPPDSRDTPPAEPLPHPFGRYELRRLLGRGGMGSVYLAHDAQLDRDVALKIPRPFGDDPNLWRERFLTEARAAATLSHPNICPVHDVGEHDGQPFLTMAYIDGETLASKLRGAGRLPVGEAVEIVTAVARAMADAHARGIVHRDLKPGNVMIDRRGRPVVMDFGLALRTDAADDLRVTLTGVALGTPAYMSPEQAGADVDAIGPPTDVYALGVMLFELTTGQTPFKGKSFGKLLAQIERDPPPVPSSLNPDIPPALDGVILTALAKAPADRFPSAAEMAEVLEQFQAGRLDELALRFGAAITAAHTADPRTRPYPAPPRKRTGWLPAVVAGFFGLLVLLAGAIYVSTDKGELKVEFLDPDTGKPIPAPANVDVKVNGQRVVLDPDGKPITVRAGDDQMLVVTGEDFVTESQTFTLKRWKDATVRVSLIPKERLAKRADERPKADAPKAQEKPKPVEFPKDKRLIEAGGWQILCGATKEQMQAWLDEKKKAGHSVTWLDVCEVDRKPLFSAVSALDIRAPKWKAILDLPSDAFRDNSFAKRIDLNAEHPVAGSGYGEGKVIRTATLWVEGAQPAAGIWDATNKAVKELIDELPKNHGVIRGVRPYPVSEGTAVAVFAYRQVGEKASCLLDASADEADDFVRQRREAGERVASFVAYPKDGKLLYAVLSAANPDKFEWRTDRGLTDLQLNEAIATQAKAAFRPASVTAYPWDGAVRYCVVWVKDPPKPVLYPKDRTLITQGDFETLVDATKEQMQAWLDEKKRAKHSVLWLDAVAVGGKPLFSAVAALDDRQPGWQAMLDVPMDDMPPPAMRKRISTEENYARSMSGYLTGEKVVTCLLWHPGVKRWAYRPNDQDMASTREELTRLSKQVGITPVVIRPMSTPNGVVLYGNYSEQRLGKSNRYTMGSSPADTTAFLDTQRKEGYRPVSFAAAAGADGLTFTVVAEPAAAGTDWQAQIDLTADKLADEAKAQAAKGFRPDCVTAYPWDGAVRYCVVWVKDPPKPVPYPKDRTLVTANGYETLLDATREQMQAWLDEKKKAMHSVLWLDAVAVGDKPVFAAVAALDGRQPDWKAFLGEPAGAAGPVLASKEFQTAVTNHSFLTLSGYTAGEKALGAALLVPGKPNLIALPNVLRSELNRFDLDLSRNGHGYRQFRPYLGFRGETFFAVATEVMTAGGKKAFDLSAEGLAEFAADRRKAGERVSTTSAYPVDGAVKFAAVSTTNPGKADWAYDIGLTAQQYKAKAADKSKDGYRPDCVTAYPWDGAVRYCVVWVKDPPKAEKREPPKGEKPVEKK